LLIGDRLSKGILKLDRGSLRPVPWGTGDHSLNIRTLARDRNGNVWMGTLGKGLLRLRGNKLEAITRAEGLSSNFINTIFEDRQGGLWLGTPEGLDRLRDPTITRFSTTEGVSSELVTSVAAAKDGSVWLGTSGGGLNRMDGRGISILRKEDGMPSNSILSLFEDRDQSLWAGTTGGLIRRTGRSLVSVKAADGSPLNRVFAIAAAPNGEIWLLNGSNGLFRQSPRGFDAASIPGLHGSSGLFQIQFDPSGALWLGFYRGEIVQVRDGRVQWRGSPDARDVVLRALYADQAGILWVGTSRGLSRLRGGRWTNWTPQHGLPEGGVISILDDAAGGLWLVTPDRLLRVRGASLEAAADGSPRNLDLSVFGLGEGIRFGANGMMANPRVSRSSDGKLWIATEDGVAMLDPAKIGNRAAIQFAVMIEQMSVDGRVLDPSRAADLSFRGRQVQFDYTAPNLIDSERTVYRYRLDGFDRDWVDAGPLRSINYTNLAAGPYRFLVTASDGTVPYSSSSPTAAVSFYVQQVFYKTSWFFALCALALLLAGWAAQRLRDRRRRERFELVLAERTRVARDLHDTILQGFAGVMFQLDVVSRHIEHAPALAREKLNRAIEHADQSLQDARLALSYMRMRAVENSTLFEAVSVAGKELADNAVSFHATLKGEPYELPIHVQANFYALAREAMTNAVNHGRPEELRLELIYSGTTVILRVSDNGTGFDPKSPSTSKDHFGLSAMKERAEQIGGTFTLTSEIGRGTQVEIVLRRRLGPSWTS
jgi:signal transduction histidine kinase/streptogramin lyase